MEPVIHESEEELFKKVLQGYKDLPEKQKKAICKQMNENLPAIFGDWIKRSQLTSYRVHTVVRREMNFVCQQLDKTIARESNKDLLEEVVFSFFRDVYPHLNDCFLKHAEKKDAGGKPTCTGFDAMEIVRKTYPEDEQLQFFEAALKWTCPDWFSEKDSKE
jgi:hypothetical protein